MGDFSIDGGLTADSSVTIDAGVSVITPRSRTVIARVATNDRRRLPDYAQHFADTLDYFFDWSVELADDVIASSTFALPDGGAQVSVSNTDTGATIFLGSVPCGRLIRLTHTITTQGGRTFDETIRILGRDTWPGVTDYGC